MVIKFHVVGVSCNWCCYTVILLNVQVLSRCPSVHMSKITFSLFAHAYHLTYEYQICQDNQSWTDRKLIWYLYPKQVAYIRLLETVCPLHVLVAGGKIRMFTMYIVVFNLWWSNDYRSNWQYENWNFSRWSYNYIIDIEKKTKVMCISREGNKKNYNLCWWTISGTIEPIQIIGSLIS